MFKKNKATILFLFRFLIVYAVLTLAYYYYLSSYAKRNENIADKITWLVAEQSAYLSNALGFESHLEQNEIEPSVNFFFEGVWVVRIIEGCNGIAVMILFVAFIIAFRGRLLDTVLFIPAGLILIHLANVFRLVVLSYVIKNYENLHVPFHDYVFPALIYGMVFLLWVVWVNFLALKPKRQD